MKKIAHLVITDSGSVHATISRPTPHFDVDGNLHQRTLRAYNQITDASFIRLLKVKRIDERAADFDKFSTLTFRA